MHAEKLAQQVRFKGMTPEERKVVIQHFRNKGMSINRIGLKLQTSSQLVHYWMRKLGIQ